MADPISHTLFQSGEVHKDKEQSKGSKTERDADDILDDRGFPL